MADVLMLLSKNLDTDIRVTREIASLNDANNIRVIDSKRREGANLFKFALDIARFWCRCVSESRKMGFAIIHSHDFDTLPVAVLIKKLRGGKLVYDAHESYSDMISSSIPRFIAKCIRKLEARLMGNADAIIVANEGIANRIAAAAHLKVMNCPSRKEISDGLRTGRSPLAPSDSVSIGYIGSLEPERFVTGSVDAVSKMDGVRLVIAGSGRYEKMIEEAVAKNERRNILFLGRLGHGDALKLASQLDLVLIMFDPINRNNSIGTPNRLFESMALGIPVIVTKGTESARIVKEVGCGYECDYDEASFRDLIQRIKADRNLMKERGAKGIAAFESSYNWEAQEIVLKSVYASLQANP